MRILERSILREQSGYRAFLLTLMGAGLTAVCGQIAVHLPGNPVPITLQVFAVVLCGMMLGSRLGMLAQVEYVAMGAMGLPVFAGFKGGWFALAGPTGGYLAGFIAAAFVVGWICERAAQATFSLRVLAGFVGVAVLYTFGRAWLAIWTGDLTGLTSWVWGVAPFVGVDCVKVIAAAAISSRR